MLPQVVHHRGGGAARLRIGAGLRPAGAGGHAPPIIEQLNTEMRNALADEAIRKRIVSDGATPRPNSPNRTMDQDRTLWGSMVRKLGLRVE